MNGYTLLFVALVILVCAFLFVIRDAITLDKDKAATALRALFGKKTP